MSDKVVKTVRELGWRMFSLRRVEVKADTNSTETLDFARAGFDMPFAQIALQSIGPSPSAFENL